MFDKVLNTHLQIKSLIIIQSIKTWRLWKISSIYLFCNELLVEALDVAFFSQTLVMISKKNYFYMSLYCKHAPARAYSSSNGRDMLKI